MLTRRKQGSQVEFEFQQNGHRHVVAEFSGGQIIPSSYKKRGIPAKIAGALVKIELGIAIDSLRNIRALFGKS